MLFWKFDCYKFVRTLHLSHGLSTCMSSSFIFLDWNKYLKWENEKGEDKAQVKVAISWDLKDWLKKVSLPHHGHCCMCKTNISIESGVEESRPMAKQTKNLILQRKWMSNIIDFLQSTPESFSSFEYQCSRWKNVSWSSSDAQSSIFSSNL